MFARLHIQYGAGNCKKGYYTFQHIEHGWNLLDNFFLTNYMYSSTTSAAKIPREAAEMFAPPHRIYNIRCCRICTLVFSILFTALLFYVSFADAPVSKLFYLTPEQSSLAEIHGIMFDAGSTGSRIHVFTFVRVKGGHLELSNEFFHEVKPGLSAYADNPEQGSQSIKGLLQKSEDVIPENRRKHTPVALKATAGLRLLPSNSSNQLLEEVRRLFQKSPYHFSQESNVDIMDGTDEGLFAWITVNFLLGGLKRDSSKLFGTLDLGGGSTQITLCPVDQKTLPEAPAGFRRFLRIAKRRISLYSHSYLGLGLMAARTAILELGQAAVGANVRLSPCIHYNYRGSWKFGIHQSINFSGDNRYGYFGCLEDVKKAVAKFKVHKPVGIDPIPMYAFSYYYERAVDLGLIHSEKGGIITVGQFQEGAKQACLQELKMSPYLCLDSTYIVALLMEGFGFTEDRKLTLQKKIDGVEVSWALGATLNLFEKMT